VTFLLDVNVLIALVDGTHVSHEKAHEWFAREGRAHWATCPITENGLVRIIASPKHPNALSSATAAIELLTRLTGLPGHEFWSDGISLRDEERFNAARILTPGQITDSYLLALAASRGCVLATLDRRLSTAVVKHGESALVQIGG
jgi:uncharacterized protein